MTVDVRGDESFESLSKRFRKEVAKARIFSTYRRKRWFTPTNGERRSDKKKAEQQRPARRPAQPWLAILGMVQNGLRRA